MSQHPLGVFALLANHLRVCRTTKLECELKVFTRAYQTALNVALVDKLFLMEKETQDSGNPCVTDTHMSDVGQFISIPSLEFP